ncbi:MAG: imidazole glycerol phosphate synthase cyclase subunit [Planctomycetota bacterium]
MMMARVIPCLDVRDGRVVKGVRFQGLRDCGDPVSLAQRYESDGADELALLDIGATPADGAHGVATLRAVRAELSIPLLAGGGVRSVGDATRLLESGADKVAVNTAAVDEPALLTRLADRFGRQCTVIAIDAVRADDGWRLVTSSGAHRVDVNAVVWAQEATERGAGEILLTSWDRDGTGNGYDLPLLRAVRSAVDVPVIASGGGRESEHMAAAIRAGADAVLAATIFHDQLTTPRFLKSELGRTGLEVRPC